jgi:membrane associated rhomboid family serine protease
MIPIRDENPAKSFPAVTLGLIAACIAAFAYQASLPPRLAQQLALMYGLVPRVITNFPELGTEALAPGLLSLLTSMFLHGDLLHLAGNMWFLWIFGNNVEDALGHLGFLLFYVLAGLAAAATQIAALPDSVVPMVGASGAIAGVLGAYMILFPHARIVTLVPFVFLYFVRLPAFIVLGMWFLFQVVHSAAPINPYRGGVAWFAHIGGFVAGMILLLVLAPRRRRRRAPQAEEDDRV